MKSSPSRITYVVRDIERALGLTPSADYHIVSNATPFSEEVQKRYPEHVTLITHPEGHSHGTAALLEHPDVIRILPHGSKILVFKNTANIETIVAAHGWHLLNPSAAVAERVENKISQVSWLGDLGTKYLPQHHIGPAKDLTWAGEPFILQWGHGHSGEGTLHITAEKELEALKHKFPERLGRTSTFVRGPSFTVNAVVADDKTLVGNISYQITGMSPFTDGTFTTIGNDWSLTHSLLDDTEISLVETITRDIGSKLAATGWRGLFGVDLMRDDELDTLHLIEINARQPASTTFESFLQNENRLHGVVGMTIFEAHLAALAGEKIDQPLIPLNDGAQVIQRVTAKIRSVNEDALGSLGLAGYITIAYPNTELNADLVRIQSLQSIMETHGKFNGRGKEISEMVSTGN